MIENDLDKVLNYMKRYVENVYEHDSEIMLNWKDIKLVLEEIERLNKALQDIKEYVEELETEEYGNQLYSIGSGEQIYILNIINEALGSEKE